MRLAISPAHYASAARLVQRDVSAWVQRGLELRFPDEDDRSLIKELLASAVLVTGGFLLWCLAGFPEHWELGDVDLIVTSEWFEYLRRSMRLQRFVWRLGSAVPPPDYQRGMLKKVQRSNYGANHLLSCTTVMIGSVPIQLLLTDRSFGQFLSHYDLEFCKFAFNFRCGIVTQRGAMLSACLREASVDVRKYYLDPMLNSLLARGEDRIHNDALQYLFHEWLPKIYARVSKYHDRGYRIHLNLRPYPFSEESAHSITTSNSVIHRLIAAFDIFWADRIVNHHEFVPNRPPAWK